MIRFFASHPTAANVLMISIIILGLTALPKLQRDTFPVIPASEVEIRSIFPGATPAEVEDAICQRIEDSLDSITGVLEIRCDARENIAITTAKKVEGADMEVFFNDVKLPHSALLGKEGEGFKIAMQVFDRSRPMVAAFAVGLLQRCLDVSLAYAKERRTMGQPIINHQSIGHKLAEMEMRLEASRLMTYRSAWLLDTGKRNTLAASCAKAFAADAAMWAATETIQIFGGYGYSPEFPAEKLFRDAKVLQIYEGTSEIQRNIIVRELANR